MAIATIPETKVLRRSKAVEAAKAIFMHRPDPDNLSRNSPSFVCSTGDALDVPVTTGEDM